MPFVRAFTPPLPSRPCSSLWSIAGEEGLDLLGDEVMAEGREVALLIDRDLLVAEPSVLATRERRLKVGSSG
jgi:hypothetical protein